MMDTPHDKDHEPIARVHFPSQVHSKQDRSWYPYSQSSAIDSSQLSIQSERYVVTGAPGWTGNVARLEFSNGQVADVMLRTEG